MHGGGGLQFQGHGKGGKRDGRAGGEGGRDTLSSFQLLDLLEKERTKIYAHPANDTYLCWELHDVMAMLYSKVVRDKVAYCAKLKPLVDFSLMLVEEVQASWEEVHPLYKTVLEEAVWVYEQLDDKRKVAELKKKLEALR